MSNLVSNVNEFDTKVYKIDGPLGRNMILKSGEKAIKIGQVLSYDEDTGKLVKYVKDTNTAFTIALSEADSSSDDAVVLVAVPNTRFNSLEIIGTDLESDFKVIKQLWGNGILLEEVK